MDCKTICLILQPIFNLENDVDGNATYQMELARLIRATGKSAQDLTIGEVLNLCEKADETYRQLCAQGAI